MSTQTRIVLSQVSRLVAALPLYVVGVGCLAALAAFTAAVALVAAFLFVGTVTSVLASPRVLWPWWLYALVVGTPAATGYYYWRAMRRTYETTAGEFLAETRAPETARERRLPTELERLCRQVDRPTPAVRVHDTDRLECLTVRRPATDSADDAVPSGADTDEVVVVSSSLCEALPDRELRGVLAHEVAHLANWDLPLVRILLAPLTLDPPEWGRSVTGMVLYAGPYLLMRAGVSLAAAVFLPGREFAADHGGATLTGDPAALATALERLDGGSARPETDLRVVHALNVVPPSHRGGFVARHSHPSTVVRVRRLRAMVEEGAAE